MQFLGLELHQGIPLFPLDDVRREAQQAAELVQALPAAVVQPVPQPHDVPLVAAQLQPHHALQLAPQVRVGRAPLGRRVRVRDHLQQRHPLAAAAAAAA
eukprot:CAMPEP_0194723774 /NCGR_PEP_ID=MMETSP0296-20130528/14750_1 /TAXON_ID=39354 /ORGANISM="Heterosigma akashiwo, Strain CCMP2393" /LENGTH=98 /DNA_ID=CAMNT_0039627321 /DNA_START=408 /DNA_END=701 /DNA_ORIENTATION=-